MTPREKSRALDEVDVLGQSSRLTSRDDVFGIEEDAPDIELEARQKVCSTCFLVHWSPLGYCPHCEYWRAKP